jgi:hypothetical protein
MVYFHIFGAAVCVMVAVGAMGRGETGWAIVGIFGAGANLAAMAKALGA